MGNVRAVQLLLGQTKIEKAWQAKQIARVRPGQEKEVDAAGRSLPLASIERLAFYQCEKSYFVGQTGERRNYGCFIFQRKGVIPPDAT